MSHFPHAVLAASLLTACILCTAAFAQTKQEHLFPTAVAQTEQERAFTAAVAKAYKERDLEAIMSLYDERGASKKVIADQTAVWKHLLANGPRPKGAVFQGAYYVPISTIKEYTTPKSPAELDKMGDIGKKSHLQSVESQKKHYAFLTQPTDRKGVPHIFNLPVSGIIVIAFSVNSQPVGGPIFPVARDKTGALRFPLLIPASTRHSH
jgi:hypothetical protein